MGSVELRNKIIQLINTDNVNYLRDVFEFAEQKKQVKNSDPFLELPPQIQELITESLKQSERGETKSHADVMAEARKRFNLSK